MVPLLDVFIKPALEIINKIIPDPQAKVQAQLEIMKLQQSTAFKELDAELEAMRGQTEVNKIEAANASVFVSGWRPAVGWVSVVALAYNYLGSPLLTWLSTRYGWAPPPDADLSDLLTILAGMLGLGTLRTVEKIKGAARV